MKKLEVSPAASKNPPMGNWLQVTSDGRVGNCLTALPKDMTGVPLLRSLGLQRELRKKYGERSKFPRSYQQEMLDVLDKAFRRCKRVLLQVPSGAGKTFIVSSAIRQEWNRKSAQHWYGGILFVAHRPEVKAQVSGSLSQYGLSHAVIGSGYAGPYGYECLTVADATNVRQFISKVSTYYIPSMIIIDEAHSVDGAVCEILMHRFPDARLLGLSSTPCSEGGKPLAETFGRLLSAWSMKRLVAGGWLRDVDVKPVAGSDAELLYKAYKEHADGKKGIVFAADSRHVRRIADCYGRHGVRSEVIGFDDKVEVQERKLNEFEAGEVEVLVCTDYFSDGMRCPDVDFVQLANAVDSLNTYLHQVGCAMHPGKDDEYGEDGITVAPRRLMVIDHAGLSAKFGLPTDERDWTQLFIGESQRKVVGKRNAKKRKEKPKEPQPAAYTKWQLRMQRLLGNTPSEDMAAQRI